MKYLRLALLTLSIAACSDAPRGNPPPEPLHTALNHARDTAPAAVEWTARWIGFPNDDADKTSRPVPLFRKEFSLDRPVTRATVHVCGLGQYELSLNGRKVGDAVIAPGWTAYAKTCSFDTYDVTGLLREGPNALGIMLGNGMYNVLRIPNRYTKFAGTFGPPRAIVQLEVEHAGGARSRIVSDSTWKAARGPVTFTHIYGGEDYDARNESPGWNTPGFPDGPWQTAAVMASPGEGGAQLIPALQPPSKVQNRFPAVKVTQPRAGEYVYDFGQNLSGWPHLRVRGPAGATVRLIPGELLAADGTVTQSAIGRPMWFSYTLKGSGADGSGGGAAVEEWRPRFTYHGFRYLQVQGAVPANVAPAQGQAQVVDLASEFIHADLPRIGTFESSDDTLNRIHALINAAILSNAQSVLTDCPHREKLGWLEQTYLMGDAVAMNYDVSSLYAKICRDMRDAQRPDGLVPDIAPEYTVFSGGFLDSPEWGSAAVIIPWMLYEHYGDRRTLEEQYDAMQRYVAYLGSKARDHIVAHGLGDWYDIGPRPPGQAQLTSVGLTSTATYFRDLDILAKAATLLGRSDDAARYTALAADVRTAFHARFYDAAAGHYEKGSQTALAMPVAAGLAEPRQQAQLVRQLAANVERNRFRVTAGDVGFAYVVKALTDFGHGNTMYRMMTQDEGPGYVMQLQKGATTLTEAWDARTGSSHNHLMLGHAEAWLYRGLAGIQQAPGSVAFDRIIIRPQIVDLATRDGRAWAKATFRSPRGMITSHWVREEDRLRLTIDVPSSSRAEVWLPGEQATGRGAGFPVPRARSEAGLSGFIVGGGHYDFITRLPAPAGTQPK